MAGAVLGLGGPRTLTPVTVSVLYREPRQLALPPWATPALRGRPSAFFWGPSGAAVTVWEGPEATSLETLLREPCYQPGREGDCPAASALPGRAPGCSVSFGELPAGRWPGRGDSVDKGLAWRRDGGQSLGNCSWLAAVRLWPPWGPGSLVRSLSGHWLCSTEGTLGWLSFQGPPKAGMGDTQILPRCRDPLFLLLPPRANRQRTSQKTKPINTKWSASKCMEACKELKKFTISGRGLRETPNLFYLVS